MKKIIEDFIPQGGKHCITNALKQVLSYYDYPISEAMIFGIASGLSFLYLNQSISPMINGRTKVFEFEEKLAKRLHITIKCKSGKDYTRIFNMTKKMIDENHPVLIYVDMPYLHYLGMNPNSHFGGHAVVLYGYDDETREFWVSDRDNHDFPIRVPTGKINQDYHLVHYDELERARCSSHRPFPASYKYLMFDFHDYQKIDKLTIKEAILETCETMLNPPAQLLGINGIWKFSKEILKWKQFSDYKLRTAGVTNYFQISHDGGTGGGIFRQLYGEFLIEASLIVNADILNSIGQQFIDVSHQWGLLADDLWQLSLDGDVRLLKKMSQSIQDIYMIEKNLYIRLQKTVHNL